MPQQDTSYVVPFDKDGTCTGPQRLEEVVGKAGAATDVFLFSHGWNNTWPTAIASYEEFFAHFAKVRAETGEPAREFRPLPVGVFWPSAILVAPGEEPPAIAGEEAVDHVAAAVAPADRPRYDALVARPALTEPELRELAAIVAPALAAEDELGTEPPPTADDLVAAWSTLPGASTAPVDVGGLIDDTGAAEATVAGLFGINPRDIVRATTVLLMKDRAGRVGGHGVATLLRRLAAAAPQARIHLVGHSYGCKVVLSALCAPSDADAVTVDSVLLLQPALSARCFSDDADGHGHPGGYRSAPARSRQPVLSTFSARDVPLTTFFHWAARRGSDLGEAVIAGEPSKYAALGGFGPQRLAPGVGVVVEPVTPPKPYDVTAGGPRIVAVHADTVIAGHGDVKTDATAWMLLSQVIG